MDEPQDAFILYVFSQVMKNHRDELPQGCALHKIPSIADAGVYWRIYVCCFSIACLLLILFFYNRSINFT